MNPRGVTDVTDNRRYLKRSSLVLKDYCERGRSAIATSLTIGASVITRESGLSTPRYQPKKSAGENLRRMIVVVSWTKRYAFIAAFTASAVIGSDRTRAPQALKMAL